MSVEILVASLHSDDAAAKLEATTHLRKLLSIESNPPIQDVLDAGALPLLVESLTAFDNPTLQFEACWAITNIASGTSAHVDHVVQSGAVELFVSILATSTSAQVKEQAIWALGNIAGDSPRWRDYVLDRDAMPALLKVFEDGAVKTMTRNATWALSNFVRGKPQPDFSQVSNALPTLARLVHTTDDEVLTDAVWALSYLSDGPNDRIQAVIDSGVVRRLIELLRHNCSDAQTQVVLSLGALDCLSELLISPKRGIRKEAIWTISNICSGTESQLQAVIEAGIVPKLVSTLRESPHELKVEACWALVNIVEVGSSKQIEYVMEQGAMAPLCTMLSSYNINIVIVVLKGLEAMLRLGERRSSPNVNKYAEQLRADEDSVECLKSLETSQSTEVFTRAMAILSEFVEN